MKNRIHDAFNEIKAEDKLKQNTYAFLQNKIHEKKSIAFKRFAVAFAFVMIIFSAGALSNNIYFTEIAFIDIDVNPGIELTLNRFDRVIGVYAYNDDGEEVLNIVHIKNKSYKDALKILIDKMVEMGYIKDVGLLTVTLQMNNSINEKELLDAMKGYINVDLQLQNKSIEQDVFSVDSDTKTYAYEQNLTPAKYLAISELQEVDPAASFDSCRDHTISEIKRQTHGHMNGSHKTGGGKGHGSCGTVNNQSSSDSNYETNVSEDDHDRTTKEHEETNRTKSRQQEKNSQDQAPAADGKHQKSEHHN